MKLTIDRLIKLIPEWKGKLIKVDPINRGITNINFKVNVDKRVFFLSIPDSDSELLNIDYRNKYYNNKICGDIKISPRVVNKGQILRIMDTLCMDTVWIRLKKTKVNVNPYTKTPFKGGGLSIYRRVTFCGNFEGLFCDRGHTSYFSSMSAMSNAVIGSKFKR